MATSQAAPPSNKRPTSGVNWDALRSQLMGKDLGNALAAAQELREKIETVNDFPSSSFLPCFSSILTGTTRPNADSVSTEHNLRNSILEVMSCMPKNDLLRPYASSILETSMAVLAKDFEDNAMLASKIIFDLHKTFRSGDQVQPYLDFVQRVYRNLPTSVQKNFHFSSQELQAAAKTTAETPFSPPKDVSTPSSQKLNKDSTSPSGGIPATPIPKLPVKSDSSFRVLTECPLTMMLLFQFYPKFLKTNIPTLIQLMMEALAIRPPKIKVEPQHKRLYYTRSRELVAAQVKTLSFLTYLLRSFGDQLKPYEDRIATNVVSLMSSCPIESIGTRKELLVATRHILATDFRKGFFRHVDSLLDERILMGSRHSDQTTIRPLGYSTLVDLVHHVRNTLSLKQISRVIFMFSRVLHDSSLQLPLTLQITAVRLLLNVVDIIYHNKDPNAQVGRDLLFRILDTLVRKLATLQSAVNRAREAEVDPPGKENKMAVEVLRVDEAEGKDDDVEIPMTLSKQKQEASCPKDENDSMEIDLIQKEDRPPAERQKTPDVKVNDDKGGMRKKLKTDSTNEKIDIISADTWMLDGGKDMECIFDVQTMVRSVIVGLKTVVWCVTNYRVPKEKDRDEATATRIHLTKTEREVLTSYIEHAIPCMKVFAPVPGKTLQSMSSEAQQQQRDIFTYFSACFTVLDSWNLRRTLGRKIKLIVDSVVADKNAMVIPRHLLGSNRRTSVEFCEILLGYLVTHMDRLAVPKSQGFVFFCTDPNSDDFENNEKKREDGKNAILEIQSYSKDELEHHERVATAHLELFERVIKSLSAFQENEGSLRPYLRKIVSSCLRLSMEKGEGWPDNYCSLLRSLFRAITAGKFEDSYKELLPVIPTVLNGLNRIFQATEDEPLRCTIIELCLTVPARLSSLLPHMPLLLRMIIPSLNSKKGDLINLGLRTLEFWIDNLNPEFLYPILSKQTSICTDLMTALTSHLRPAPYPYGHLGLRLLGKLGGKNRRFLRESVMIPNAEQDRLVSVLSMKCEWSLAKSDVLQDLLVKMQLEVPEEDLSPSTGAFSFPMPIETALNVLKTAAQIDTNSLKADEDEGELGEFDSVLKPVLSMNADMLCREAADTVDLTGYCQDVVLNTLAVQSKDAFEVLCAGLATLVDLDGLSPDLTRLVETGRPPTVTLDEELGSHPPMPSTTSPQEIDCVKTIVQGLLYGLSVNSLKSDSFICLKGIFLHYIGLLAGFSEYVIRIDANGSKLEAGDIPEMDEKEAASQDNVPPTTEGDASKDDTKPPESPKKQTPFDKLGSLRPFGYFAMTGPFERSNPLVLCEALAEILSETSMTVQSNAVSFFEAVLKDAAALSAPASIGIDVENESTGQLAFYESMLESLCRFAVIKPWNVVSGLRSAISTMIRVLGPTWAKRYEVELIQVAIASVKNSGKEIPFAGVRAFQFFVNIFVSLYGRPSSWEGNSSFVLDVLAIEAQQKTYYKGEEEAETTNAEAVCFLSDSVLNLLIVELASTKQLTRFAARYALKFHFFERMLPLEREKRLTSHLSTIKRVLFTRSLRLLPLPEQVAVIEALSTLVDFAPALLPVADQHLLAFLSEFLKLSSIADGEMTDASIVGFVVDKNGFTGKGSSLKDSLEHVTGIFLRRECIARLCGDKFILIPQELSTGVQLRVSALRLLNTVIRRHADGFF